MSKVVTDPAEPSPPSLLDPPPKPQEVSNSAAAAAPATTAPRRLCFFIGPRSVGSASVLCTSCQFDVMLCALFDCLTSNKDHVTRLCCDDGHWVKAVGSQLGHFSPPATEARCRRPVPRTIHYGPDQGLVPFPPGAAGSVGRSPRDPGKSRQGAHLRPSAPSRQKASATWRFPRPLRHGRERGTCANPRPLDVPRGIGEWRG